MLKFHFDVEGKKLFLRLFVSFKFSAKNVGERGCKLALGGKIQAQCSGRVDFS
jgi:hypothetical protein